MGRLTKDPDIRYTTGEKPTAIARFNLAVDRKFKKDGEPTADFISCVAFGKVAEIIEKHVTKGTKIIANGEWRTGNYTNKDGNKIYTNDCFVSSIEFCESKNSSQNNDNTPPMPPTGNDGFINVPNNIDEELPFS